MNILLKGTCVLIYALAAAGLFVPFPGNTGTTIQYAALILLGAHALEVLVAFASVKLYKGPLAVSVFLTLLFGFLHWRPLAKEDSRAFK
jgi:uncharacterized protein YhhL (DUF1145 family)